MTDDSMEAARAAALDGEDDYDLLTYTEVGLRLDEAIAEQMQILKSDPTAQQRLDALIAARERNSGRAVNDENFEKFFGYAPAEKRTGLA